MTMTDTASTNRREELRQKVRSKIVALQNGYLNNRSAEVASLARLRRGIHTLPGSDPAIWAETLEGLPNEKYTGDNPTAMEQAVHATLCLYAIHQQGRRAEPMHQSGRTHSFGHATRSLGASIGAEDAVRRRFEALATATSFEETLHHARGLVTQLRAAKIPLDYGQFALDLEDLQKPSRADSVRLRWGRDYYSFSKKEADSSTDETPRPGTTTGEDQ